MNFNHLLNEKRTTQACRGQQTECYWIPTGNIRSMVGGHVHVSLYCRHCNRREEIFLTTEEFKVQESLIINEMKKEMERAAARQ